LAALLHDAAEYVIGDLISPFKTAVGLDYKAFENRLARAIHITVRAPPETRRKKLRSSNAPTACRPISKRRNWPGLGSKRRAISSCAARYLSAAADAADPHGSQAQFLDRFRRVM
jgi:hypothetical protein